MDGLLDRLARPGLAPFLFAAALVLGLLAVALALVGVDTTLSDGWDAAEGSLGQDRPGQGGPDQGGARTSGVGLLHILGLAELPLTV